MSAIAAFEGRGEQTATIQRLACGYIAGTRSA